MEPRGRIGKDACAVAGFGREKTASIFLTDFENELRTTSFGKMCICINTEGGSVDGKSDG